MAVIGKMHRDTKELLIGFCAVVLFGVALIVWPSFGDFVDRFAFRICGGWSRCFSAADRELGALNNKP
jgi:hypothetical protein